ncbi:MAG: helix-turn-helix domain-containing protein [Bacteroidetes bacterium]|jgi:excisionase family DNA binding protein|nr:helix-turn-helix domain-containing protein [Bacteroidota bacterium]MBT3933339.1 helix-turn-helix domain-containing protein [Bacteroidota bacterium]MBT4851321.1 helix-turn-helix domain-containing protein [Candidatus Neomarinimicrobiota bacterium]MBT5528797.1 helix-turn-helix domain-containing protein [Cytophagia bacterium]
MIELPQFDNRLKRIENLLKLDKSCRWMTLKKAIEYTSLSTSTIRRAVYSGKLKASKTTGKLLFKISELDEWLKNG